MMKLINIKATVIYKCAKKPYKRDQSVCNTHININRDEVKYIDSEMRQCLLIQILVKL